MPSKTFMNLSLEKQEKIKLAAMKEFASVTFEKVSINKIIKDANISRGSFYMYFEDIYDLAIYLIEDSKNQIMDRMKNNPAIIKGDLFNLIIAYHNEVYDFYTVDNYRNFFKNFIVYFQGMPENKMHAIKGVMKKNNDFVNLLKILDKSQFKNKSKEYIKSVAELALVAFRNVMFQTYIKDLSKEESKKILITYLEILKAGYGGIENA